MSIYKKISEEGHAHEGCGQGLRRSVGKYLISLKTEKMKRRLHQRLLSLIRRMRNGDRNPLNGPMRRRIRVYRHPDHWNSGFGCAVVEASMKGVVRVSVIVRVLECHLRNSTNVHI